MSRGRSGLWFVSTYLLRIKNRIAPFSRQFVWGELILLTAERAVSIVSLALDKPAQQAICLSVIRKGYWFIVHWAVLSYNWGPPVLWPSSSRIAAYYLLACTAVYDIPPCGNMIELNSALCVKLIALFTKFSLKPILKSSEWSQTKTLYGNKRTTHQISRSVRTGRLWWTGRRRG